MKVNLPKFWEPHVKRYTAYGVIILGVFVAMIEVAHVFNLLEFLHQEVVNAVIIFATFTLVALLVEQLFSNETEIETFKERSDEKQKWTLEKQELTLERLKDLTERVKSATGITSYSDVEAFEQKWHKLRDKYDFLMVVGEVPVNYREEVDRIYEEDKKDPAKMKDKRLRIYRSLTTKSEDEISDIVGVISDGRPNLVGVYHMYGFEWGSWVMGHNQQENETEVLLNYANEDHGALNGLHLTGDAAKSFEKSISPHLHQVGIRGVSYHPLPLVSQKQVELIVEEKVAYQKKITEIADLGFSFESPSQICKVMTDLLRETKQYLDVTHLCVDAGAIDRLKDPEFEGWIKANYDAARRGVKIRRIFIVERQFYGYAVLQDVMNEMRSNGIDVALCPLDDLRSGFREDFSIYDGKHLVHMDRARSYWSGSGEPLARRTENPETINAYEYIFKALQRQAEGES